jgi:hypothetical protein
MTDLPTDTQIELAALADGSLAGAHREQALARVRDSEELQSALSEQRRVVELTAAADVRAPQSLHRQVEAMLTPSARGGEHGFARREPRTVRPGLITRRFGFAALATRRVGFAALAAVVTIAVVGAIGLIGRTAHPSSSGLGVQQAAALTLSPATGQAPMENEQHRSQLTVAVGGVSFPYWEERFGWRSSGTRSDRVGGHTVTTVFYTDGAGRRVGYAIASGRAPTTSGGTVVRRWGVTYRLLSHDGATVVTWARGGHLCVMAGRGVSAGTLLNLASWGSEKPHAA